VLRRTERQQAVIDHLRARAPQPVSAATLARRFDVTRRTIERDLQALQAAGVPLYATAGRSGGYSVLDTYSLPPLNLTLYEAYAAAVGLALLDTSPFSDDAATTLDKIVAGLPVSVRAALVSRPKPARIRPQTVTNTHAWLTALGTDRLVELTYRSGEHPPSTRTVEPYQLLHASGNFYLIGWCRTRGGVRGFRTDRITSIRVTDITFTPTHGHDVETDLHRWTTQPMQIP
jgi:predicted DNA-binding transcriptional regulator YafY